MQVMMKKMERSRCTSSILLFFDGDLRVWMRKRSRSKRFLSQGMQLIHSIYYLSIPQLIFFILLYIFEDENLHTVFLKLPSSLVSCLFLEWQVGWREKLLVLPSGGASCSDGSTKSSWWALLPEFLFTKLNSTSSNFRAAWNCGLFHFTSALLSVGERIDSCSYWSF